MTPNMRLSRRVFARMDSPERSHLALVFERWASIDGGHVKVFLIVMKDQLMELSLDRRLSVMSKAEFELRSCIGSDGIDERSLVGFRTVSDIATQDFLDAIGEMGLKISALEDENSQLRTSLEHLETIRSAEILSTDASRGGTG